jgi:hypothetical protein
MNMTLLEIYKSLGDLAIITGMTLAVIYVVLSLIYFVYRYAKGDDIPKFTSIPTLTITNLSDIRFYINPFYFKHPVNCLMTAMSIFLIPFIVAVGWPVVIPLAVICYFIQRTRKVNLDKKKMWEELKS